jgi:hypothetical protein
MIELFEIIAIAYLCLVVGTLIWVNFKLSKLDKALDTFADKLLKEESKSNPALIKAFRNHRKPRSASEFAFSSFSCRNPKCTIPSVIHKDHQLCTNCHGSVPVFNPEFGILNSTHGCNKCMPNKLSLESLMKPIKLK